MQDDSGICNTVQSDLADGTFHATTTDYGDSYALSGTLYVAQEWKDTVWKVNHIYQTADSP